MLLVPFLFLKVSLHLHSLSFLLLDSHDRFPSDDEKKTCVCYFKTLRRKLNTDVVPFAVTLERISRFQTDNGC